MAQDKLTHPALDQLIATPEIFRALLAAVPESQTAWKPAADRWSIAEVLEHLAHIEAHLFRFRLDAILAQDSPTLEDYDQDALYRAGTYSGRDPEESFAHWEEQREDNIELLADLNPVVLTRKGVHATLGEFTLEALLNAWAHHDLSHVRQLADLVRTAVYLPGMGALGRCV